MAAQLPEADDMDFALRDVFRTIVSAAPDSAHTWATLRPRSANERPITLWPRLIFGALSYPLLPEWALDWHLLSLGRRAR